MDPKQAAAPSIEPMAGIPASSPRPALGAVSTRRHRHHGKKERKHHDRAHSLELEDADAGGFQEWPPLGFLGPLHSSDPLQSYQPSQLTRRTASEPVAGQEQAEDQTFASSEPHPPDAIPDPGTAEYLSLAMALAAFVLIVALQLAFAAPLPHQQKVAQAQRESPVCVSEQCRHYGKLLAEAVNTSASPCDSFYAYACGRWNALHSRSGEESVLAESWGQLARRAASRLRMVPDPTGNPKPVHRASHFVYTCLAIIRVPRIPEINNLLAKGNITWPRHSDHPDFLGSLFYMSRQLFVPVAFDVAALETEGPETPPSYKYLTLHFSQSRRFKEHVKALGSLRRSGQLLGHLRLTYETLTGGGNVNESRVKELASHYDYLEDFFQDYEKAVDYVTRSDNVSFFLQYTPSVPKDRWDAVMRQYLDVSLLQEGSSSKLRGGVVIQDVDLFATLFDVHAKHGEFFTNDVVGGLCVQTLAEYASFDILTSLFGSPAVATQRIYDSCFSNAYRFYGHAIDAYFHQPLSREVVALRHVATIVHETFDNQRRGGKIPNAISWGIFNTSNRHRNFDFALSGLDKLNMKALTEHYEGYPNMTDSPVYDWIQHAAFASSTGRVTAKDPLAAAMSSEIHRLAGRFQNFRLALAHMEEPFYAPNVSAAVLMAGVGARLAAALFYDHVETSGGPDGTSGPEKLYAENHECLFPGTGVFPDHEIQGAVASVGVAWNAFKTANSSSMSNTDWRRVGAGGIGSLKEAELFFVFFCYLHCGNRDGERMCNVPLQHSADFSRMFGCANTSFMNPRKKCEMVR